MMSDQGWGQTSSGGNISLVLLEVEQPVVTNAECEKSHETIFDQFNTNDSYTYMNTTSEGKICAGGVAGKGICQVNKLLKGFLIKLLTTKRQGDSGGPLTYNGGTQHILIGESVAVLNVSGFPACGGLVQTEDGELRELDGIYNVYGRVSHYRKWIEENMNSPTFCGSGPDADE